MPSTVADVGLAETDGCRQRVSVFTSSDPFTFIAPMSLATVQFNGARFRFGNLLPVVLCARASTVPFRRPSAPILARLSRLRFDSYADVERRLPSMTSLPVSAGGGDLRLIFILIPWSTMVARWSDEADIFCRCSGGRPAMMVIGRP